jgi:hypothetical protein
MVPGEESGEKQTLFAPALQNGFSPLSTPGTVTPVQTTQTRAMDEQG